MTMMTEIRENRDAVARHVKIRVVDTDDGGKKRSVVEFKMVEAGRVVVVENLVVVKIEEADAKLPCKGRQIGSLCLLWLEAKAGGIDCYCFSLPPDDWQFSWVWVKKASPPNRSAASHCFSPSPSTALVSGGC